MPPLYSVSRRIVSVADAVWMADSQVKHAAQLYFKRTVYNDTVRGVGRKFSRSSYGYTAHGEHCAALHEYLGADGLVLESVYAVAQLRGTSRDGIYVEQ